jgi:hypothetical protein
MVGLLGASSGDAGLLGKAPRQGELRWREIEGGALGRRENRSPARELGAIGREGHGVEFDRELEPRHRDAVRDRDAIVGEEVDLAFVERGDPMISGPDRRDGTVPANHPGRFGVRVTSQTASWARQSKPATKVLSSISFQN